MSAFGGGFKVNCSLPTTPYHYISGPSSRGTLDILWTCLTAVLIATWSVQHLNIPAQRPEKTWKEVSGHFFQTAARKIFWMVVMLVAPELFVGAALMYYISARVSEKDMKKFADEDDTEWSVTHGFFANMGGFVIKFQPVNHSPDEITSQVAVPGVLEAEDHTVATPTTPSLSVLPTAIKSGNQTKRSHFLGMGAGLKNEKDREWYDKFVGHNDMVHGHRCPCLPNHTEANFHPMSIPDIAAHLVGFWNGRFWVNPAKFHLPYVLTHDTEMGASQSPNAISTSQALVSFASRQNVNFKDINNIGSCLAALHGTEWTLDARQLYLARSLGIINKLPLVTEEEICDQSKGDFVIKAVALAQSLYIIVQLIVRKSEGLSSSQLEVMAVAFSGCAMLVYAFSFQKPQDVHVPRYFSASRYPTSEEILIIAAAGPFQFLPPGFRGQSLIPNLALHYCGDWISSPEGRLVQNSGAPPQIFIWGAVLGSTLFGALHYVASNFQFPTHAESVLWKISSILTFAVPIPLLFSSLGNIQFVRKMFGKGTNKIMSLVLRKTVFVKFTVWKVSTNGKASGFFKRVRESMYLWVLVLLPVWVGSFVYIVCRLFLLVESFRSLFYLPTDTFKTTEWGIEIVPHLG